MLDFFAGSGTTGRVCIEEGRNSVLVDSDPKLIEYFDLHLSQINGDMFIKPYTILRDKDVKEALEKLSNVNMLAEMDVA